MSSATIFDVLRSVRTARGLPKHARAVLWELVGYWNSKTGLVWPSVRTLTVATGWGRRSVQEGLRELVRLGIITVVGERSGGQSEHGRGRSTRYRINLDRLGEMSAPAAPLKSASAESEGRSLRPERAQAGRPKGAHGAPKVSNEVDTEGKSEGARAPTERHPRSGQEPDGWGLDAAFAGGGFP